MWTFLGEFIGVAIQEPRFTPNNTILAIKCLKEREMSPMTKSLCVTHIIAG
jgi:hypothetical protein